MMPRNGWSVLLFSACVLAGTTAQAKTVTVGSSDNRTGLSLNLGDTLIVELPAGAVPGFRWVSRLPRQAALTSLNDTTVPAADGRPEMTQFRYNAAVEGDVALVLGFESADKTPGSSQDASTFSVQVHVASGAPASGTAVLFGVYKGTLPCADCTGLETTLRLYAKGKFDTTYAFFVRTQTYHNAPHGDITFSDRGDWAVLRGDAVDPNATVYQLNPDDQKRADSFLLKEKGAALMQLGRDQKPIDSPMNMTLRHVNQSQ